MDEIKDLMQQWDKYSSKEMDEKMSSRMLNAEKRSIAKATLTLVSSKNSDIFTSEENAKIEEMRFFLEKVV